jgi:pimeloyl-ACP methyl ester carboxylesterase
MRWAARSRPGCRACWETEVIGTAPRFVSALAAATLLAIGSAGCGAGDGDDDTATAVAAPAFGSIKLGDLGPCRPLPNKPEYRCGSIEVPFERSDPSYGTTEIGFAVLPRRERRSPPRGAIFMVEGGPGYASTGTAGLFSRVVRPLRDHHDVVLVDQRGQGRSEQYDCPDLQAGAGPEFVTVAECAARLGERFISYRTSAAADDIDWVRQALGYERIALYGDSYGTFLGQSYAYRHGDRLEALVLDSAYPAYGEDPWYPSLPRTGIRSLGIACDRAPRCDGDAVARLGRAVRVLREQRRPVTDLITALIDAAYGPPATYLAIDRALSDLLAGDPTAYEKLVAPGRAGIRNDNRYQRAGELIVGCNDYPMIWDRTASEPERRAQLERAIRAYPSDAFEPFTTREIAYAEGTSYLECLTFPPPTDVYEPAVDPETQEPTEAPVLVVSGELDDVTTPSEGRTVAGFFADSRQYIVPNAGHVDALYYPNGLASERIRRFLGRVLGISGPG